MAKSASHEPPHHEIFLTQKLLIKFLFSEGNLKILHRTSTKVNECHSFSAQSLQFKVLYKLPAHIVSSGGENNYETNSKTSTFEGVGTAGANITTGQESERREDLRNKMRGKWNLKLCVRYITAERAYRRQSF